MPEKKSNPPLSLPTAERLFGSLKREFFGALRSKFVLGTGSLMLYTVLGQFIGVVSSFALTRLYGPHDFGLFGVFSSFPLFVANALCLNYDFATPAPKCEDEGVAVAAGAMLVATVMSIILTTVFAMMVLTNALGFGVLPRTAWVPMFVFLFLSGTTSTLQYWCVRQQKLNVLGHGAVLQNGSRATVQIGLGALLNGTWFGLVSGEIAGRAALFVYYLKTAAQDVVLFRGMSLGRIASALQRHARFAVVLLPPMLIDAVLAALPVPLMNLLFGLGAAGQFYLMRRVLDVPVTFISRTVGDAFYGKMSEYARISPTRIRHALTKIFLVLVAAAGLGALPLVLFGPSLFAVVFGSEWREAGLLAAITVPSLVMNIGVAPVGRVFALTSRPQLRYVYTIVNVLGAIVLFGSVWHYHKSLMWTATGLSLLYVLSYSIYLATAYIAAGSISKYEHENRT